MKLPLLRRKDGSHELVVNFDPKLVELLREVKYFLLLGLSVPSSALNIYKKAEIFRRQTGNLELIVNMYNNVLTSLLPVEAPLMKGDLDKIDKALQQGVKNINWKSHGIDYFLTECMGSAKNLEGERMRFWLLHRDAPEGARCDILWYPVIVVRIGQFKLLGCQSRERSLSKNGRGWLPIRATVFAKYASLLFFLLIGSTAQCRG